MATGCMKRLVRRFVMAAGLATGLVGGMAEAQTVPTVSSSSVIQGPHTTMAPAPGVDYVLIDKSDRTLALIQNGRPIRTFRVALGFAPNGHKYNEGDGRTPEGTYTIDWRNPNSRFYRSLHINYPNEADKARARALGRSPGGAIMIHGLPNHMSWAGPLHRLYDWTNGCIAVTNREMDVIWRMVPDGTPVMIRH